LPYFHKGRKKKEKKRKEKKVTRFCFHNLIGSQQSKRVLRITFMFIIHLQSNLAKPFYG